jgi:prophage tail gpP-like protein
MSNPIPGRQYTVVQDDTLSHIATRAYGDPNEWPRIFQANQSALKSGSPDLIFPGEVLNIPVLPEIEDIKSRFFQSRGVTDGIELKIGDRILPIQSGSVTKTMDTAADGWTALFAWDPGADSEIDKLTSPYRYSKAVVSLDGKLAVSGRLYTVSPKFDGKGHSKTLKGFSYTIDAVDSHMKPPYEANSVTLEQRARELLKPLGIGVQVDPNIDISGQFDRVTGTPTETIFSHLRKLAEQRKAMLSSTPSGDLLITKADIVSPIAPVGTLEEGVSFVSEFSGTFDGRKRFNVYRTIGQGALKKDQKVGIAKDDLVPLSRFRTFRVNDSLKGEMNQAAVWIRNQETAKAQTIPLSLDSWNAPNGEQWQVNTKIFIKSITLGIPGGFTFIITRIDFGWSPKGKKSIIHILPVSFYSDGDLLSPW